MINDDNTSNDNDYYFMICIQNKIKLVSVVRKYNHVVEIIMSASGLLLNLDVTQQNHEIIAKYLFNIFRLLLSRWLKI